MRTFLALVAGVSAGVALAVTLGGRALADTRLVLPVAPTAPEPEPAPVPLAAAGATAATPDIEAPAAVPFGDAPAVQPTSGATSETPEEFAAATAAALEFEPEDADTLEAELDAVAEQIDDESEEKGGPA